MWGTIRYYMLNVAVAPREGRVSRNLPAYPPDWQAIVAPREGRVSRNVSLFLGMAFGGVAPREGRVSRNLRNTPCDGIQFQSRPARGV